MSLISQETGVYDSHLDGYMRPPPGEEVVISGISGIFPSSDNTTEFMENLFANVDMVTEKDLGFQHPEAPKHVGSISGTNRFDAQFFKISNNQAASMDPQSRKLLEQSYSALYDAGINPLTLKGKKIGVFIGSCYSDNAESMYNIINKKKEFTVTGLSKNKFSNRISYWIDSKGPSYTLNSTCTSSMVCLERAFNALSMGDCEAAIIGGSNICQLNHLGLSMRRANMVTLDGKTKCFDKNADGYVRSDAIGCIYLQKAKDAKRIYAEVYNVQTMYGLYGDERFLSLRKSEEIEKFLNNFYIQTKVSPKEVEYVEAEGAAQPESDVNELQAIANVFGKDKNNPVLVGSVKSNIGHCDAASGVCSIAKVCLAYQKGQLPANLHCLDPVDVNVLKEGKVKLVTKNEPFSRGFTAINQFSFAGMNCHALLKGHFKPKDILKYKSHIPRLVLISGRHDDDVKKIIHTLENQPLDPEVIGMLHNIYQIDTPGHLGRGYIVLDENEKGESKSIAQNVEYYSGTKRPLCLVFSGMGAQWPGMAADLMRIPTFAAAIQKCHKTLEPFGIDLISTLTEPDKSIFDNILNCCVGIIGTQIGLIDVLKEIGVNPDHIIGHSQGEMSCAYWDGGLTTEETILGAYYRGKVSLDGKFVKGSMAAIGLGHKKVKLMCPPEIDIACHNSFESTTISGPVDEINKFVGELTSKGIFAKVVPSANIAYHSRYVQHIGIPYLEKMSDTIRKPKLRSEKWLSTSLPRERWGEDLAKYCSSEYHTNNLVSPVYFEEAAQLIPSNAVVVEVAPHGLLQAILKRSHPECVHIPLTKRGHANPVNFFLEAIGKMHMEGQNLKMDVLYPKIEYPVSTETQMISQLVDWSQGAEWKNTVIDSLDKIVTSVAREFIASVHDDEYKLIAGHIRDGVITFPESGILVLVWETLASYIGVDYRDLSVVFNDVYFHGEVIVPMEETFKLNFLLSKGSDYFEVTHKGVLLANGYIAKVSRPKFSIRETENDMNVDVTLKADDIYKYLHAKGLTYRDELQSIHSTNFKRSVARIKYTENWIVLLDSLIQLNLLAKDYEGISIPKLIKKLTINTGDPLKKNMITVGNEKFYNARYYNDYDVTRCGGIEIKQILFKDKPRFESEPDVLHSQVFIPNINTNEVNIYTAIHLNLQIIAENVQNKTIKLTEVVSDSKSSLLHFINKVADDIPFVNIEISTINIEEVKGDLKDSNVVVLNGTMTRENFNIIHKDTFILMFGQNFNEFKNIATINVLSSVRVQGEDVILLKIRCPMQEDTVKYIIIDDDGKFDWVSNVNNEMQIQNRVVLVSEKQPRSGLFGFVKNLKKKYANNIGLVIVEDNLAPKFDENKPLFKEQLEKNLTFNVLQKGQWGSYYFQPSATPLVLSTWTTNVQSLKLLSGTHRYLDSLHWSEANVTGNDTNTVQICYAGVSIKDSQKAVGITKSDGEGFGSDFSGLNFKGKRVMGLIPAGAMSSKVEANPNLLWPVPEHWTLEEAASIPVPYALAYYCLVVRAQVMKGHSIFLTGGAGALGQAVISICLALECDIHTCVSDKQKKEFLLKLFPKLKENNIGISQNGDFYELVVNNTDGKLCKIVISCASGIQREAATKCLAPFGMFMDVNDFDWKNNQQIGMFFLEDDRNYCAAQLSSLLKPENLKEQKLIQCLIADGIMNGQVRPLTRVVFPPTEVSRAFRLLALNKNRGRALIKIWNPETSTEEMKVVPRTSYSANGTYIIVCDETELGVELANRLVGRGARKLILNLKTKALPGSMHIRMKSWNNLSAQVKTSFEKLNSAQNCSQFLKDAEKLGPVMGVFIIQGSTAAKEKLMELDFAKNYDDTSKIVYNLDLISRNNCRKLSNFVVILRTSENPVDEYTNSVSENICQARVKTGLPAVSLKIELMDEIQIDKWNDNKLRPQNVTTFLNALDLSVSTKESNHITYNLKRKEDEDFVEKIAKSLGLKNLNDVYPELTVKDFILNDVVLEELKSTLKRASNIEFANSNLRDLSIGRLKILTKANTKYDSIFEWSLGAFYSFIDPEVHVASYPSVQMKTAVINRYADPSELDANATHLLLIPGFEGHHHIFEKACERLKVRALTYQLPPDLITSIPEMANGIFENIKKTFVFKSKFYLLGYSFGVNVALEVAALLEKEGYVGVVFCVDSSPDVIHAQLDAYVGNKSDSDLHNTIIEHFFHLMSGERSPELNEHIKKLKNWPDKVKFCVSKLKKLVSYSIMYMHNFIESAYKRIQLAKTFRPNLRLESELVLLKGIAHPNSGNLDSDYGLSKYTTKPVKVFDLKSDHVNVTQDCRVSNIVNKLIDPELIENHISYICQSYIEG